MPRRAERRRAPEAGASLDGWFPDASEGIGRRRRARWRLLVPLAAVAAATGVAVAGLAAPAVGGAGVAVRSATEWFEDLPSDLPLDTVLPRRSVMFAADGRTVVAQLFDANRVPVALAEVPVVMVDAVLAIEDDRYYERGPIDVRGTARALLNNLRGRSTQGGSTITQQFVKNLLLAAAQTEEDEAAATADTVDRKVREARLAVEAERLLGKDGVLQGYLNTAYFGRGAYGVAAASQRWFGVPLARVSLPQAALLAALLKGPTAFDPIETPERALGRRDTVLLRMWETGRITRDEYDRAVDTPLGIRLTAPRNGCASSKWPFFCQAVLESLADEPALGATPDAREAVLAAGGLRIVTTLDPAAMASAQAAVDAAFTPSSRVATALATVEPGTGRVVALATNRRFGQGSRSRTEIVLPTRRAFQTGSTFKPITLAAALTGGMSPYERIDTPNGYVPAGLNSPPGGFNNDNRRGNGRLDAYAAMARSVNTWFVQVVERAGVRPVAAFARAMGMRGLPTSGRGAPGRRDASITLGAFESSPLEVASVYATLAAGGVSCRPLFVTSLSRTDQEGRTARLRAPDAGCRRVLEPAVARTVVDVLRGVMRPGGTGAAMALDARDAFGKTGTTNNSGATWFAGATAQFATAVWVGDPRGPTFSADGAEAYGRTYDQVFGSTIAGPIWKDATERLSAGLPPVDLPPADPAGLLALSPSLVPDVVGSTLPAAVDALVSAGFEVTVSRRTADPDPRWSPGMVVTTSPAAGSPVPPGGSVEIELSDGSNLPRPGARAVPSRRP